MGNRLIVIDTDAIIDFFGNISPGAEVVSELISNGEAVLTSITVFELYAGVEGKRRLSQIETLVRDLMVLPLDAIEAATAGKIYTQLKMKGQLIGTNDILIAAVCLANGLPLYTKNVTHFLKIKDIQILTREEILRY